MILPMHSIFCGRHPLRVQVGVGVPGRGPQQVADRVGDQAVDLLGHVPVAAAQPGLEVHHRDPQLCAHHGAGGGGIHVAHYDERVGALALRHSLVGDHGAAGLLGVRTAADLQMVGGVGQRQIAEEGIRHIGVVVLPGMHDAWCAPALARQLVVQGRHLHEIGPGGGDQMNKFRLQACSDSFAGCGPGRSE